MTKVGDSIKAGNARWSFGDEVPARFDAHVRRSVPFYDQGHELVARLSDHYVADDSLIYDLGCSTGTLAQRLAKRVADRNVRIIALDREPEMVRLAGERCRHLASVEVRQADLADAELEPADFIVAYYSMQFVRPRFRQLVFDRIYQALNWGGALVLFEKVRAPDARFQDTMTQLYTDYKLEQGYNEAEILAKARSLKGVLEPFSTQGNLDLLARAGFVDVMSLYKYVCFEGFLAIK